MLKSLIAVITLSTGLVSPVLHASGPYSDELAACKYTASVDAEAVGAPVDTYFIQRCSGPYSMWNIMHPPGDIHAAQFRWEECRNFVSGGAPYGQEEYNGNVLQFCAVPYINYLGYSPQAMDESLFVNTLYRDISDARVVQFIHGFWGAYSGGEEKLPEPQLN